MNNIFGEMKMFVLEEEGGLLPEEEENLRLLPEHEDLHHFLEGKILLPPEEDEEDMFLPRSDPLPPEDMSLLPEEENMILGEKKI